MLMETDVSDIVEMSNERTPKPWPLQNSTKEEILEEDKTSFRQIKRRWRDLYKVKWKSGEREGHGMGEMGEDICKKAKIKTFASKDFSSLLLLSSSSIQFFFSFTLYLYSFHTFQSHRCELSSFIRLLCLFMCSMFPQNIRARNISSCG
jgi:hypothetical protein